jgi:hypothetical protein
MMKSAVFGLAALSVAVSGGVAQSKMDCAEVYKSVWPKLEHEKYAHISGEQLADLSRLALRAYDACQAGDEQNAKVFFEKIAELTTEWGNETSTGPYNPNATR